MSSLKMFTPMVPIRFDVWHEVNREDLKKAFEALNFVEDEKDCDECDGYGTEECDLGHEHNCEACGGSGKVDETEEEALEAYAIAQYHAAVEKDKEKMKVYYAERDNDRKS